MNFGESLGTCQFVTLMETSYDIIQQHLQELKLTSVVSTLQWVWPRCFNLVEILKCSLQTPTIPQCLTVSPLLEDS